MANKKVRNYQAGWMKGKDKSSSGHGWIRVFFEGGGDKHFSVSATDYHGLVDVLRNEKPLVWDDGSNFLHTLVEDVGEEES